MTSASGGGGDDLLQKKKEFLEQFFKKGAEFSAELLRENERLRFRVVKLEEELAALARSHPSDATLSDLVTKIHALEQERERLLRRFVDAGSGVQDYLGRYEEIERENNNLASLYVATSQLHSTYDPKEALAVVAEILLNFVGVKRFATYLIDGTGRARAIDAVDVAVDTLPVYVVGQELVGRVLETGHAHVGPVDHPARPPADPIVCLPLLMHGRAVGAIALWAMFEQKTALVEVDHDIFALLSSNAASALDAARLTTAADAGKLPKLDFSSVAELLTTAPARGPAPSGSDAPGT